MRGVNDGKYKNHIVMSEATPTKTQELVNSMREIYLG
jgi:hypothetical protein